MTLELPAGCTPAPACLDYQAFVFALPPALTASAFARLRDGLRGMGRIRREALGVIYVDGDWGFLVIPPYGFPELKINFFHGIPADGARRILVRVAALLAEADAASAFRAASPSEQN